MGIDVCVECFRGAGAGDPGIHLPDPGRHLHAGRVCRDPDDRRQRTGRHADVGQLRDGSSRDSGPWPYASDVVWSSGRAYFPHPSFDPSTPTPQFELDLGNKYGLSGLVVWGDPRENRNEATDFTLEFSTDGGQSWGNSVQVSTGRLLGSASAKLDLPGGFVEANRVRLTVTGNAASKGYAPGKPGGDRVVVGELRFVGRLLPSDATGQILKGVRLYPSALGITVGGFTFGRAPCPER